jgi:hypothetical protein
VIDEHRGEQIGPYRAAHPEFQSVARQPIVHAQTFTPP